MSNDSYTKGTIDLSSIEITLEDAKTVERPFIAIVTQDAYEDGRVYNPGDVGAQWHPIVTPLRPEAKGMHDFLPLKFKKASEKGQPDVFNDGLDGRPREFSMAGAFGRVSESYLKAFGSKNADGSPRRAGHGQLNGLIGWFVQRTLTYGKDPTTGELRGAGGRPNIVALRKATAQEIAEAGGAEGVANTQAVKVYTESDIETALELLSGKKAIEFQRKAIKAEFSDPSINTDVLQGIMSKYLVDNGFATQDGAIINRVIATPVAA